VRRGKGYSQYCSVAYALDVLGDRWTLLVVRDLLMGPKRYTDLREGLPGIATDILTARLRTLEEAGFVRRRELPRPAPATVYELTEPGRRLGPVVAALGRVGLELIGTPRPEDDIRAERLVLALRLTFREEDFADLAESYALVIDGEPFGVTVERGMVGTAHGAPPNPAMSLTTDSRTFVALMCGEVTPAEALEAGRMEVAGDTAALGRFLDAFTSVARDAVA
jgi:DNA-binding HxlR family transcriptional regulator/putative sterol carrier protein